VNSAACTERKNIIDHACIRAAITEASTDHKTPWIAPVILEAL